jgi:hypothetical protein
MKRSAELRQRADHYRLLKGRFDDRRVLQALGELANDVEEIGCHGLSGDGRR